MVKVVRVTFHIPDDVRRAVALVAAREGIKLGEALALLVERAAPDELRTAREAIEASKPAPRIKKPPA